MPIACGDSSVTGTRKVVSSTSQSEMPSMPRWKRIPSGAIQTLSTSSWKPASAASKSGRISSDTRKVTIAVARPRPRWIASSSRGTSMTRRGAEQRQQRDPAEQAHQRTSTFCLRLSFVPQRGSLTSTRIVYWPGRG